MIALLFLAALTPQRELEDATIHFSEASRVFQEDVQRSVTQKYNARKAGILRAYEDRIQGLEVEERSKRGNAIATFEAFLKKHPKDPEYSPDAMFRLAELYFERSNDEYFVAMRKFEDEAAKNENAVAPQQNYASSVALYEKLIKDFDGYRLLDAAYYLLGYCLGEQGQEQRANDTYLALVDKFPESRFLSEAWTRIGEYYFDKGDLPLAVGAYEHVLQFKESSFFDKALYKLGWTFYRMDKLDDAVARFTQLVDYSEARVQAGGGGGELRNEAIQYLGISFGDERWGGLKKAKAFFDATPKPWSHEVFAMLGDVYFDQSKYPEAISALSLALAVGPQNKDAPKRRDKQIQAFEKMRDFEGAARAREAIGTDYAEGSPWYEANQHDTDATATARELTEKSLLAAAIFHHKQAQALKELKKPAEGDYALAADSYEKYLDRFPGAKNRYELSYYLADCQFYAGHMLKAAEAFGRVADDESNDQHREVSAYSAVVAAEQAIKDLEAKSALVPRPVLTSTQRKTAPEEIPLAPARKLLVEASDRYAERVPSNEKTAPIMYKAAELLYAHDHFEEARPRFQKIIDTYPKTDVARFSANLMIESYIAEKDWDAVETFSAEATKKLGGSDELKKFRLGALFKKAEALEEKEEWEKAAAEYLLIVNENPKADLADKALNNAAVDYEKARRFESATKLYERIPREYPQSSLADAALFRVGVNSERFYDFNKAIAAYLQLAERYEKSPKRPDAVYNAALALENTQQYSRAIDQYKLYAVMFPDRKDAADVFFRAGRAAEASGDKERAIATYGEFISRYKAKQKASDERVVEAYLRTGVLQENRAALLNAVKEASARSAGVAYAAEAQFRAAEIEFKEYDAVTLEGGSKQQKGAIVKRATLLKKASDAYQAVFPFKQVEWTLAALYRIGNLYETFADKLFAAPAPPEIKKLGPEYVEEYRVLIEEQAVPLEDKAVEAYKRAVAEAKKSGVANEWTKRTQKSLNKLRKNEFPLQKDARQPIETFSVDDPVGMEKKAREELKAHPTDLAVRERAIAAMVAQNRLPEAEKACLDVLKFDEKNAGAMLNLSRVYMLQNKAELALFAANNAREIAPDRADIQHQLGVLALKRNERAKALALFKKAVELDPSLVASQLDIVILSAEAADFEGALAAAEAATVAAPTSRRVQLALGNAYRGVQRFQDAESTYSKLLEKDAKNPDALYNRAVLYLDAEIPGVDMIARLEKSVKDFDAFTQLTTPTADEKALAASYATQAKRRIESEKKIRERNEKRKAKS